MFLLAEVTNSVIEQFVLDHPTAFVCLVASLAVLVHSYKLQVQCQYFALKKHYIDSGYYEHYDEKTGRIIWKFNSSFCETTNNDDESEFDRQIRLSSMNIDDDED